MAFMQVQQAKQVWFDSGKTGNIAFQLENIVASFFAHFTVA